MIKISTYFEKETPSMIISVKIIITIKQFSRLVTNYSINFNKIQFLR